MVKVEPNTKTEKRKVLTGSAILHWGCKRGEGMAGSMKHPGTYLPILTPWVDFAKEKDK